MNKTWKPLNRKLTSACLAAACLALVAPDANAGLADFEAIQSANANLVFQYRFEGGSDASRLADWAGHGYTLQRVVGSGGGNVNDIQFVTGFDGTSQAYQPSFSLSAANNGAGLNTINTVPYGTNVTVEAIVQVDEYTEPTGNSGGVYILSARNTANSQHRAYFLKQRPANEIATTLGDNNNDSLAFVSPYTAGNWYYVALTAEYDSGGNVTTVNLYRADLSAAQATIEHVLADSTTFNGPWAGLSQFGVGAFIGGNQQFMQGRIDNVALTGGILSSNDFQSRLNALYIAAPSCQSASIVVHPTNQTASLNGTASFSTLAQGTSPTYQWQVSTNSGVNWDNVSTGTGGTSPTYTTATLAMTNSGNQFRCIVSVACDSSSVTSAVATLTVTAPLLATWTGAAGDLNWNTASNWNFLTVPSAGMTALIPASFTVNYSTPGSAFSTLTNSSTLNLSAIGFSNSFTWFPVATGMLNVNSGGQMGVGGDVALYLGSGISIAPGGSLNANRLIIGANATGGTSSGTASSYGRVTNNGGILIASTTMLNPGNGAIASSTGTDASPTLQINGGTNRLGAVSIQRAAGNTSNPGTPNALGRDGLIINNGIVEMTSLSIGNNAYGTTLVAGGTVTNTGNTIATNATAGRPSRFLQTGGLYVGGGSLIITPSGTAQAIGSITGGTNILNGIQLGGGSAGGTVRFTNSGAIYLGTGGIAHNGVVAIENRLNPGGLFGAQQDWTGNAALTLGAGDFTFRAAALDETPRNITYNAALGGTGPLVKTGAGTLTLDAGQNYSAATRINEGTLALGGSGSLASSDIVLASGTKFDVSAVFGYTLPALKTLAGFGGIQGDVALASTAILSPGTNGATGTLTFSNSLTQTGGAVTHFDLSSNPSGPDNDVVVILGDLNVSGLNTLDIAGGGTAGSVHPLFKYSGNFNGDLSNFTVQGATGVLTNITSTTPKSIALRIQVSVRGPTNTVWVGNSVVNDWDLLNRTNWLNGSSLDFFVTGDAVTFNAVGAANPNVNIAELVQPGSVRVDAATDYTFSGPGAIGGSGALTKTNSGKLTIQNDNTFTGGVNFNGGTVSVASLVDSGNPSPLGSAGTLAFGGGTLEYTGGNVTWSRDLTLNADGGGIAVTDGTTLTQSGVIGGAGALTKTGNGTLVLNNVSSGYGGGTAINAGTLTINTVSGAGSGPITLNSGTLALGAVKPSNSIVINGQSILRGGNNGGLTGVSAVSGSADFTLEVTTGVFDFIGSLASYSGTITCSNVGGGTVRFNGTTGSSLATFDLGQETMDLFIRNSLLNVNIGGLKGGPSTTLSGRGTSDNSGPTTLHIGANGQSTVFDGVIRNGSGAASTTSVVKTGAGTLTLTGGSTYTGTTVVSNGVLKVNGSLGTNTVTVVGGSLAGTGFLNGPVTVESGGNLAPGASIGTLYVYSDLTLNGTFTAEVNTSEFPNADQVAGLTSVTYGGTLAISNLGPAIVVTDTFQLFSASAYSGAFASITPTQPAPGLYWDTSTLTNDGVLRITTTPTVDTTPTNIVSSVSGGNLTLSWPSSHTGWTLQVQTNSRSVGLVAATNAWFDVANSSTTNQVVIPINPANPTVFFRLRYPQ